MMTQRPPIAQGHAQTQYGGGRQAAGRSSFIQTQQGILLSASEQVWLSIGIKLSIFTALLIFMIEFSFLRGDRWRSRQGDSCI